MATRAARLWAQLIRHRFKLVDGSLVLVLTCLAAFYCFEVDVFASDESSTAVKMITLEEVMIVAAIFCAGLTIFALRRLKEARRETLRRIAAEREARSMALHDALTGLPNRRNFDEALQVAIASPPRSGGSHVLLLMDLNGFKRVNDLYGHQAGDEVLVQVGGRLARAVRDGDLVARLGGDEFAVLAMHTAGVESATGLAGRIIDALAQPISTGEGQHDVGVAIGIALIPSDGDTADALLRKADVALYRAKEEKKHKLSAMRFFEVAMDAQAEERDQLERELRQAIAEGNIKPFYQPLVALDGSGIVGFEALARWTSPQLGDVPPERFIAVAEDAGLIRDLTVLLLKQACATAVTWPANVTLSFNVSGAALQDPLFGLGIMQILTETGLQAHRLELEITESALVRDLEAARTALDIVRGVGVRIALDDFGTGYSSLYHLRAFKPDKIKIDRSFVDGMEHDADSAAIVNALIGLGSGLGAKITAEGVENQQQLALLEAQGCDQGQGYLFSKAVDAGQAFAMLEQSATAAHQAAG
ncbi:MULTISPECIES: EAL domain-containing protein [unclassified Sphingomonas]|nr:MULTISPECIES: EAL domain-containing protein [unclassified Sphingomonas]